MTAGQSLERNVQLARWTDMAKQGWYSGDPHIHSWRSDSPARHLHHHLRQGHGRPHDRHYELLPATATGCLQAQYGKADVIMRATTGWNPARKIRARASTKKATSPRSISSSPCATDRYRQYSYVFDGVHAQGGLVGYDHLAWSGRSIAARSRRPARLGRQHQHHPRQGGFLQHPQNNNLGLQDYYDFLNLGVKVTATAGTDYPAPVVGEEITYAYTGTSKFSPDTWYAAVKKGSTFVSNGPMLAFTVGDAMPGDDPPEQEREAEDSRAGARAGIDRRAQGARDRRARSRDPRGGFAQPAAGQTVVDFEVTAAESQWIAARTTSFNGAVAHTTPVYVIVDNKSFLDHAKLRKCREAAKGAGLHRAKTADRCQIHEELGARRSRAAQVANSRRAGEIPVRTANTLTPITFSGTARWRNPPLRNGGPPSLIRRPGLAGTACCG